MDVFENSPPLESKSSRFRRMMRSVEPRRFGWFHSPCDNAVLSIIWVVSGILTVAVPLIHRNIHKNKYQDMYLSYYWEHEYRQYAENRKQNYEKYGNNYNYYGAYTNSYADYEWVDVNNCKWYKPFCFSFYANREGEPMPNQEWYPTWYSGFQTTEEERMEMEDNLENPGSLKFVYVWQLIIFIAIMVYGTVVIRNNRNPTGLIVALLVWSNFAFISMWLMADNSIETEGERAFRWGFYGQISVLIFMTNFWYFLQGLVFAIIFWVRGSCLAEQRQREIEAQKMVDERKRELEEEEHEKFNDEGYKAPSN